MTNKYIFSGHESFPCKTLWLKKGYDFVIQGKDFNSSEAVIDLGVGKNMVAAIRFWLRVFGICENDQLTWLGIYLMTRTAKINIWKTWQRFGFCIFILYIEMTQRFTTGFLLIFREAESRSLGKV